MTTSGWPGTWTCLAGTWGSGPGWPHYADLLHATPGAIGADACTQDEALAALVVAAGAAEADTGEGLAGDEAELLAGLTPRGQQLALSLSLSMAAQAASQPPTVEEA